ncbi:MAG: EndoU domain-containing protein [Sneathiella sp.]|nr:EndoU domain-containing protein [Sneathiella sp.]
MRSNQRPVKLLWVVTLLFLVSCTTNTGNAVADATADEWSDTTPSINLTHIFKGQINKHGKPVGFHDASRVVEPDGSKIKKIVSGPNKAGVYTAIVEIYDPGEKKWKEKFSSFYPDDLSKQQIIEAILNAISHDMLQSSAKWRGPSGHGFMIEGYRTRTGAIATAYPVFIAD